MAGVASDVRSDGCTNYHNSGIKKDAGTTAGVAVSGEFAGHLGPGHEDEVEVAGPVKKCSIAFA